jgi:hypothetical protein
MQKKRHQMTVDFPKELQLRMRMQALKRGMTMREWLICIVAEAINRELELEK